MASEKINFVRVSSDESGGTKRAAGYIRVNGDKQTKSSSEAAQRITIRNYCSAKGWDFNELYVDEGQSPRGEEPEVRPEYLRMMAAVKEGRYDIVVTCSFDRISRDAIRMCDTIKAFGRCGISFVSIREDLYFSGPMGPVLMALFSALAELHSANISCNNEKDTA